jgi:hypothetical protein
MTTELAKTSASSIILICRQAIKDGVKEVGVWHADFEDVSNAVEHIKNDGWDNTRFVPTPDLSASRQGWLIVIGKTSQLSK